MLRALLRLFGIGRPVAEATKPETPHAPRYPPHLIRTGPFGEATETPKEMARHHVGKLHDLYLRFEDTPTVTVTGLTKLISRSTYPGKDSWSLLIIFEAWRIDDGPLQETEIHLLREMTEEEDFDLFGANIDYETIVTVEARIIEKTHTPHPIAWLERVVTCPADDAVFIEHLTTLNTPIIRETERFGLMTWNRRFKKFEGKTEWLDTTVDFELAGPSDADFEASLAHAHAFFDDTGLWRDRIAIKIAEDLYGTYYDGWADGKPRSEKAFSEGPKPEVIQFSADGMFTVLFDDGDAFQGHAISVLGTMQDGVQRATMMG